MFPKVTQMSKLSMLIVLIVVMAAAEFNALVGTTGAGKKMLSTVKGTIWGGVVLTAILYFAMELLFP
ncbi:MAG: hypothetical protein FJ027_24415, partial [Candidatus Rokubacteria bacterium]|nr:hypothetical protein [Candidatus Rokubacteria bacterium]